MKNKQFKATELKMPDNPNSWLNSVPPAILGAIMAIIVAILRVIYDPHETNLMRMILESLICGVLSLTFSYGIMALGLNNNFSVFAGGVIGYLGSSTIRALSIDFIKKKLK